MKQANSLTLTPKLKISPRLSESLTILTAPAYALEKVLDDYTANPLVEIVSPFRQGAPAGNRALERATAAETTSLEAYLFEQINLLTCTRAERQALFLIASALDHKGFFTASLSSIAAQTGLTLDRAEELLRVIQTLDPPGIGARDYRESMKTQLRAKGLLTEHAALIIDRYLPELAERRFDKIEAAAGIDPAYSRQLLSQIKKLRPSPAQSFILSPPVIYIEPDIVVENAGENIHVHLNPANIYRIKIYEADFHALPGALSAAEQQVLSGYIREARWLKSAVKKRYDTLLAIAKKLCELQRGYFLHGDMAMLPLTKDSLAQILGIHPSTVTRALHEKYIKSPQGIQPASYLFSGHARLNGDYSPIQIKQYIQKLILQENKCCPESDGRIAACLSAAGIEISRRTVAKYRLSIGISPAHIRIKKG
jgi:RNA polymerase sigma-54 factor